MYVLCQNRQSALVNSKWVNLKFVRDKLKSGWNLDLKGKLKSEFWGEEVVGEKDCADWLDFGFFLTPNGSGSDLTFLKYHTEGCPLFKFVDIYEGGGSVLKGFPWPPPRL